MGSHITVTRLTSQQHEGIRHSPASSPSPPPTLCSSLRTLKPPMLLFTEWPDKCAHLRCLKTSSLGQDLPRPPEGGSRRRRTWTLQLMPHMAPRLLVALRAKPTEAPARARDMRCSPPGDIITLSPSTLENTTK